MSVCHCEDGRSSCDCNKKLQRYSHAPLSDHCRRGLNPIAHARDGNVKPRCAAVFVAAGIVGPSIGPSRGNLIDGPRL
jgi:hypothetical protein